MPVTSSKCTSFCMVTSACAVPGRSARVAVPKAARAEIQACFFMRNPLFVSYPEVGSYRRPADPAPRRAGGPIDAFFTILSPPNILPTRIYREYGCHSWRTLLAYAPESAILFVGE